MTDPQQAQQTAPSSDDPYPLDLWGAEKPAVPRWAWWLGAGLTLVVLGGATAVIVWGAASGERGAASAVAERYVEAIADGDADAANELARVNLDSPENAVLASDALSEAERIADAEVGRLRVNGEAGEAEARIDYRLAGRSHTDTIRLVQDGGGWYVDDGLVYDLAMYGYATAPAGIEGFDGPVPLEYGSAPAHGWGSDGSYSDEGYVGGPTGMRAYPGVYTVVPPNEFFDLVSDGRLEVSPRAEPRWDEWVIPNRAYEAEVDRQVEEWFDACADERTVGALAECGILVDAYAGASDRDLVTDVEIDRYPSFEGYDSGWGELGGEGRFTVTLDGERSEGETVDATSDGAEVSVEATEDGLELSFLFYSAY
ncbi:hypothetical protein JD276_09840 [Leucobacter sp. CSA1]|uniref:DUF4878 domain-containing protein n=1 Tax=Leucobacter chromiisoli TaxID=2796471 RepID=A0A934Q8N8_9MICO|nr:hypothetical protein [Leucobacter chromiisoli]MBK0419335.1 hypothetical protein [Leucobacter chromiisoli]